MNESSTLFISQSSYERRKFSQSQLEMKLLIHRGRINLLKKKTSRKILYFYNQFDFLFVFEQPIRDHDSKPVENLLNLEIRDRDRFV